MHSLSYYSIKLLAVQDLLEHEAIDKVKWNMNYTYPNFYCK